MKRLFDVTTGRGTFLVQVETKTCECDGVKHMVSVLSPKTKEEIGCAAIRVFEKVNRAFLDFIESDVEGVGVGSALLKVVDYLVRCEGGVNFIAGKFAPAGDAERTISFYRKNGYRISGFPEKREDFGKRNLYDSPSVEKYLARAPKDYEEGIKICEKPHTKLNDDGNGK